MPLRPAGAALRGVASMIVVAAEVFKKAFIPQKLADIDHYEREIAKMGSKGAENNGGCVPVLRSPWRVLVWLTRSGYVVFVAL